MECWLTSSLMSNYTKREKESERLVKIRARQNMFKAKAAEINKIENSDFTEISQTNFIPKQS